MSEETRCPFVDLACQQVLADAELSAAVSRFSDERVDLFDDLGHFLLDVTSSIAPYDLNQLIAWGRAERGRGQAAGYQAAQRAICAAIGAAPVGRL